MLEPTEVQKAFGDELLRFTDPKNQGESNNLHKWPEFLLPFFYSTSSHQKIGLNGKLYLLLKQLLGQRMLKNGHDSVNIKADLIFETIAFLYFSKKVAQV